ncbi:MAG: TrkA family potassium uptake protein [Marivita sp.]|uniref:potassium channel family protein n=1 Tax=Marivita sp. TaxID=2003365 RepID=UPI0025BD4C45|nr:TrkA family potassium uptake protein [Marivita sp.]MCI5110458.1 TrkA family potassium uptake protein [Marivita sp.]
MRVVILGASRFGAAIAEKLIEENHEVVLIDKDRDRLEKLSERLDCGMIEGDGTMPSVLEDTYRDEKDAFVAVTNASEDNILAALVARSIGFGRVIPQIVSSQLVNVCRQLELHDVINPHATVAESIADALEDKTALDQEAVLQNELSLKRIMVPERLEGTPFGEIDLPDGVRGIAVIRGESESLLSNDHELSSQDCLLFAVERSRLEVLNALFDVTGT